MAASIFETSILNVSSSISTRTGRAPNISIGLIVAIKLYGVVITSSPSPTPAAYKAQ